MKPTAHFQVDSRLATLLGENYRSSEYAVKELIDNSWDADAENVWITFPSPMTMDPIVVRDDGSGMTEKEILNEYLVVANDRRSRKGERTPFKNRLVKGRKGIGKFAGLMVASSMVIETKSRGVVTTLHISRDALLQARNDLEKIDLPYETKEYNSAEHGTLITLSSLNQNFTFPNPDKLKQLLILDYGRKPEFKIFVNGEIIDIEDIPGENFSEKTDISGAGEVKLRFAIAESKKGLKQPGIIVRVNGKVVGKPNFLGLEDDEEVPDKLLKKVYGEIEADGLADDVTADWGAIIENSKAYQSLKEWAKPILKSKFEDAFTKEINLAKARLQKEINRRIERLPEYRKEFAKNAIEKVLRRFYGETEEKISVITSVILDAFEQDEYWLVIQKIEEAKKQDIQTFAEALGKFGIIDIALMAQQAIRRMRFLDELDELVKNQSTLEGAIHVALEKNFWVFGTDYSIMSSNQTLARVIEEYTHRKFTSERANKRPDLFLGHDFLNRHLLVEFKRPSETIGRDEESQAVKYRDDLTPDFGKIDIIVLGGHVDQKVSSHYERPDIKLMSYNSLISSARSQLDWLIKELTKH